MKYKIVVDSCSDLTKELKEEGHFRSVPLTLQVGGKSFIDDDTFQQKEFIRLVKESPDCAKTACPSPEAFFRAYDENDAEMVFVITLSQQLSGTYNSAVLGKKMYEEEYPGKKKIHVVDSESACCGETVIGFKIQELAEAGLPFEEIVERAEAFRDEMKTYFVLEDLDTLRKNGRLSLVSGLIASVLSICPVMSDNGDGEIRMLAKVRGILPALSRLTSTVMDMTRSAARQSIRLVISNCNCPERAQTLRNDLLNDCPALKEIVMLSTGALSSTYANNGGIIIAFAQS